MTAVMRDDQELFKQFMDNAQLQALAHRHRILARLRAGKHSVKHLPTQGCEEWSSQTPAAQGKASLATSTVRLIHSVPLRAKYGIVWP